MVVRTLGWYAPSGTGSLYGVQESLSHLGYRTRPRDPSPVVGVDGVETRGVKGLSADSPSHEPPRLTYETDTKERVGREGPRPNLTPCVPRDTASGLHPGRKSSPMIHRLEIWTMDTVPHYDNGARNGLEVRYHRDVGERDTGPRTEWTSSPVGS